MVSDPEKSGNVCVRASSDERLVILGRDYVARRIESPREEKRLHDDIRGRIENRVEYRESFRIKYIVSRSVGPPLELGPSQTRIEIARDSRLGDGVIAQKVVGLDHAVAGNR